jgi:hypothetical protein
MLPDHTVYDYNPLGKQFWILLLSVQIMGPLHPSCTLTLDRFTKGENLEMFSNVVVLCGALPDPCPDPTIQALLQFIPACSLKDQNLVLWAHSIKMPLDYNTHYFKQLQLIYCITHYSWFTVLPITLSNYSWFTVLPITLSNYSWFIVLPITLSNRSWFTVLPI